jgi:hypothetical protein
MNIVHLPINTKSKTINVDGFNISMVQWDRVVICAHGLYENQAFDEEHEKDTVYRQGMIFESLELMSNRKTALGDDEASNYDPQVDALFELIGDTGVKMIVEFGEKKYWKFITNIITEYWIKRQAYENNGADLIRIKYSSGIINEIGRQPQTHWSYGDEFKQAQIVSRHSF